MSGDTRTRPSLLDSMTVDVPEGRSGKMVVSRFDVEADSLENIRLSFQPGNRWCKPGTYTRLLECDDPDDPNTQGTFWMSDTTAERRDHLSAAMEMRDRGGRVLIGGLGLGMIVRCALLATPVEHVDVLERSRDVINLVGEHYEKMAADVGKTLTIRRCADALAWEPPPKARWSVVYFDVWPDLHDDNLAEMAMLGRRYNRKRADVFLAWGRELLRAQRRLDNRTRW